ncbi:hypothetical protein COL154_012289 [Colletotrichum chrysophilum]|nr:hypothetical protein COL154_012289 [Colletotrichum chrysophilum]
MKSLNWSLTLMLGLSSSLTVAATLRTRACTFTWAAVEGETCESMSSDWGIPLSQFLTLNPSVGPNCENGLTPGVEYCVEGEVGPGTTSTVASVTATSTSASSTTSGPSVPSPTQPGLIETSMLGTQRLATLAPVSGLDTSFVSESPAPQRLHQQRALPPQADQVPRHQRSRD